MPRPISSRMTRRALAGLVQDRRGLHHLDHEGRAAAREIVGGADAAEQAIDHADPRRLGRHEGADLRQHRDERVLAQEGRFTGHVRAGHQPQRGARARGRNRLATKAPAFWRRAPPRPPDGGRLRSRRCGSSSHFRAHPIARRARARASAAPTSSVSASAAAGFGDRRRAGDDLAGEIGRRGAAPAPARGRRHGRSCCSSSASSSGGEAHGIGHALPEHEARGRSFSLSAWTRRRLDVIADHVVVPDLQRWRSRSRSCSRASRSSTNCREPSRSFAQLVQVRRVAVRDEAAVARQKRQLARSARGEGVDQFGVMAESATSAASSSVGRRRQRRAAAISVRKAAACCRAVADRGEIARAAARRRSSATARVRDRARWRRASRSAVAQGVIAPAELHQVQARGRWRRDR